MYYAVYAELNLLCALILVYILVKLRAADRRTELLAFTRVVWATLVILLADTLWALLEQRQDPRLIPLDYLLSALYLFDAGLISYLWLIYIELKLKNWAVLRRGVLAALAVPLAVLAVLCLTAPFSRGLFYVDGACVYHRGGLYFVQLLVSYGYAAAASVRLISRLRRADSRWARSELLVLLSFLLLPVLGGAASAVWYGLPAVWPCGALSLLMVFINLQSRQISTDQLTELNNRRIFDRYLAELLAARRVFSLLMIDVDGFKRINDTRGHVEGDRALRITALVLKETVGPYGAFLARYGGDEFAVLLPERPERDAQRLALEIHAAFARRNEKPETALPITVSVGAAAWRPGDTAERLIAEADSRLYRQKRARGAAVRGDDR